MARIVERQIFNFRCPKATVVDGRDIQYSFLSRWLFSAIVVVAQVVVVHAVVVAHLVVVVVNDKVHCSCSCCYTLWSCHFALFCLILYCESSFLIILNIQ